MLQLLKFPGTIPVSSQAEFRVLTICRNGLSVRLRSSMIFRDQPVREFVLKKHENRASNGDVQHVLVLGRQLTR